jgi:hypothetical protein
MLRNSGKDMDRELVRVGHVGRDEIDARLHQAREEVQVAAEAIELRHYQLGLLLATGGKDLSKFGAIRPLARLRLGKLCH